MVLTHENNLDWVKDYPLTRLEGRKRKREKEKKILKRQISISTNKDYMVSLLIGQAETLISGAEKTTHSVLKEYSRMKKMGVTT